MKLINELDEKTQDELFHFLIHHVKDKYIYEEITTDLDDFLANQGFKLKCNFAVYDAPIWFYEYNDGAHIEIYYGKVDKALILCYRDKYGYIINDQPFSIVSELIQFIKE